MSYNNNSDGNGCPNPRRVRVTVDNYAGPSVETQMESLYIPDNNRTARPFLYLHMDLQSMLRALEPWQLALLGRFATISLRWNDRALQSAQSIDTSRFMPENLKTIVKDIWFKEIKEIDDAYDFGFPIDVWYWMFRQDPTQPRQVSGTSESAPSAQATTLSLEHPEVADERPQADYPSKRRCLNSPRDILQQEQGAGSSTSAAYRPSGPSQTGDLEPRQPTLWKSQPWRTCEVEWDHNKGGPGQQEAAPSPTRQQQQQRPLQTWYNGLSHNSQQDSRSSHGGQFRNGHPQ
ncbi:hypothetical protein CDV36_015999 [Fusarium kuroshium]|uniref:Uncharacterized protein n=1 Tax=Fusarium kuroshium TaxID=2010991 RepID=A0A3M2R397_9HYPO|nr:hypothetical protein CDV36_015999 [Fusarium kuroshium]